MYLEGDESKLPRGDVGSNQGEASVLFVTSQKDSDVMNQVF